MADTLSDSAERLVLLPLWGWAVAGFVLGALIGSHIATLVLRWPRGESAFAGRSHCDHCGATLGPVDLVPLAGWIALGGKCRVCSARIDPRHPLIEALAALIGLAAFTVFPGWFGLAGAVFGWLLLALAMLDADHLWLPNGLVAALAVAGLAAGAAGLDPPLVDRLIGGVAGFGALWLIAFAYARVRKRRGLGGGDPKLLGAIGLWLGWQALPFVLLAASMAGLSYVVTRLVIGRSVTASDRLPFGLFLALSAWPIWFVVGALP